MVTDRHTDTQMNAYKNILLRFCEEKNAQVPLNTLVHLLKKNYVHSSYL